MTIRWITPQLGTGAALFVLGEQHDAEIVDVRELVDKGGNRAKTVRAKIDEAVSILRRGGKAIICCDYGISRSNAVAAGVIALYNNVDFASAVRTVQTATGEHEIKLEPLEAVRVALGHADRKKDEASRQSVLVTGAYGFIGQSLLPILRHDCEVSAPLRDEIDLEAGSTQLGLLAREQEVDCIVHLANPRIYTSNKALGATLAMLRNVIEVCTSSGIRLVYLSGWEVYSAYCGTILADESLPMHPKGPYGDAKYLAELLIAQHVRLGSLRAAVLRSGPVYGIGSDRPKFIYNFLERARSGVPIITHHYINGHPALDLMHVLDLATAIAAAVRAPVVGDFNLGTGALTTTLKIAHDIVSFLGSSSPVSSIPVDSMHASVAMDCGKALNTLNWSSTVSFEDGLKRLII